MSLITRIDNAKASFQIHFKEAKSFVSVKASTVRCTVSTVSNKIFSDLAALTKDTSGLASFIKLASFSIKIIGRATGNLGAGAALLGSLSKTATINDIVTTFFPGLHHAVKDREVESTAKKLGNWAVFASGTGCLGSILSSSGLINLGGISSAIGSIPFVGSVLAGISLGLVASVAITTAFGMFAIDAAQRVVKSEDSDERSKALAELAWCVSEVVFGVAILSGVVSTAGILALGITSAVLGCANFLHAHSVDARNK